MSEYRPDMNVQIIVLSGLKTTMMPAGMRTGRRKSNKTDDLDTRNDHMNTPVIKPAPQALISQFGS